MTSQLNLSRSEILAEDEECLVFSEDSPFSEDKIKEHIEGSGLSAKQPMHPSNTEGSHRKRQPTDQTEKPSQHEDESEEDVPVDDSLSFNPHAPDVSLASQAPPPSNAVRPFEPTSNAPTIAQGPQGPK